MRRYSPILVALAILSSAMAVTTSSFTHVQPADFERGTFHQTVVSSAGDLRLSRSTTQLIGEDPRFDITQVILPLPNGGALLGTGPEGLIVKLEDAKEKTGESKRPTEFFKAPGSTMCTSLCLASDSTVLAGFSGESAALYRIDLATRAGKKLFAPEGMQFIWAICAMPDGSAILGTGPNGEVVRVWPDGKSKVLLATKQHNILCVTAIGKDEVAIGTDPDGLVIRLNVDTGEWFAMYDAEEPEITAIVADADGTLYAAGSAVTEAAEAEAQEPSGPAGRKELSPDIPLRRESPAVPQPPQLPDPTPGEPEPIPKDVKKLSVGDPMEMPRPVPASQPAHAGRVPSPTPMQPGNGSAIYKIAKSGSVSEIFRKPVTIHSLLMQKQTLIIGTGPEGGIYELRPAAEESAQIAQSESRQVSAMAMDRDGRVLLGLSNPGGLLRMDAGYASSGTYTSELLDAQQIATFGKLQLQGTLGVGSTMTISTRSGNVKDPDAGGWSKWSNEKPAAEFMQIESPSARFLQYRLTLGTKDPATTPMVEKVTLNYLVSNMAPKITSVSVEPEAVEMAGGVPKASPATHTIGWEASDPNNDEMIFSVHYRLGHRGEWVLLKDKIKDNSLEWNTRNMADGRYELRVTADDSPSNADGALQAMRFSNPVVIDNTPPVIGDIKSVVNGKSAEISARVVDRTSTVARVSYSVDSNDDWQGVNASDMLYDSPDETVKFVVKELAPGPHQVTVRASDSKGNTAYETLLVTVEGRK